MNNFLKTEHVEEVQHLKVNCLVSPVFTTMEKNPWKHIQGSCMIVVFTWNNIGLAWKRYSIKCPNHTSWNWTVRDIENWLRSTNMADGQYEKKSADFNSLDKLGSNIKEY